MASIVQWKIGGEAGFGIMTAGAIFSKACSRGGLHVFGYSEYPSLIRGGHNSFQAAVSEEKVGCQVTPVNVLVALNRETVDLHKGELSREAAVIFDPDKTSVDKMPGFKLVPVPFARIATETAGLELMSNNVALGASVAVLDYDIGLLLDVIRDQFKGKGEDVIRKNTESANAGYEYVKKNFPGKFKYKIQRAKSPAKILMTGNEAIGAGAIAAGCKFYSGYPMTPTSGLLHFMASQERKYGLIVKHAEDEISAINMAIGAAHTGARSMTATSGGGFCLMVEGLGLAGMTETPLVIAMGQRAGPSTGLPTWTEQSDLKFVLNASHGEFPRIVLAPGDVEELFYSTVKAFNLAEKYQTPVIIMYDKHIAESHCTVDSIESVEIEEGLKVGENTPGYKRYQFTKTGVSPRAFPGQKGNFFIANSDEHDEKGHSTESAELRKAMVEKRMRKLEHAEIDSCRLHGPKKAPITLIGWGSTKGAIKQAMERLASKGVKANFLQMTCISPFPEKMVSAILKGKRPKLIVENNYSGQLAFVICEHTGIQVSHKLLKFDGRPFYPEEIELEAKKVARK
ncbi:2-oxoacid:acceptor oxidoreductase subunit alpha [Candidatus Woesearchaeota archaeon]|nr:2-oxoacid:acceptor oxidoreductase subunit alpha [Candidatus Woesearchaeota archaeon]